MEEIKMLRTKFWTDLQPVDRKAKKRLQEWIPSPARPPRYSRYSPLSAPRSRILEEALQMNLIPPPRKLMKQTSFENLK